MAKGGDHIHVTLSVSVRGTLIARDCDFTTERPAAMLISGTFGANADALVRQVEKMLAEVYSPPKG